MVSLRRIGAGALLPALFCLLTVAAPAAAQGKPAEPSRSLLESIAHGLHRVGEKTQEYLRPGFSPLGEVDIIDFSDKTPVSREFSENLPVRPGTRVSISNEFGEVRVDTWREPVVRIRAEITAGADDYDRALEIVNGVSIEIQSEDDAVEIRTHYPDTRDMGNVAKEVNFTVTVPKDADVSCRNSFGDVSIAGVGGDVALDVQFGQVELRDIGGRAQARARGELPFTVTNVRGGGAFELRGSQATFSNIADRLEVSNFLGEIEIRDLAADVRVDASNDSGPIRLYLGPNAKPDLEVYVMFGALRSDIPLHPTSSGELTYGRSANVEARQEVRLQTAFGDVEVYSAGEAPANATQSATSGEYTEDVRDRVVAMPEGGELYVKAIAGNVRIEGADEDRLSVKATHIVRTAPDADARVALDALTVKVSEEGNRVTLETAALADMASLGATYHRIDLVITCPRTAPIRVEAADGHTLVRGTGGRIQVDQARGRITVEHGKGALELTNREGDIHVANCAGPLKATATQGSVSTLEVFGMQDISCEGGRTVLDAPRGEVRVRQRGGDVRILPLEGIGGGFDVLAEGGNVSILVPDAADVTLFATARNGQVRSAIPLTGEIGKGYQRFQGRPEGSPTGRYQVMLETVDGDIIID